MSETVTTEKKPNGYCSKNGDVRPCFCIGPQNGEPLCPCRMKDVEVRSGRFIQKERDLGPTNVLEGIVL